MSDDAVGCIVRDHNIIRDTYFLWNVGNLISVRYQVLSKLFLHVQDIICVYIFSFSFHILISNFSPSI
jgi:hypothetical protein